MKTKFLLLLFIPFISFGQLTTDDKKVIDAYASDFCGCFNNIINELNPKVVEFISYMAKNGEAKANTYLQEMISGMDEDQQAELYASFGKLESEEFGNKIGKCDTSPNISAEFKKQLDDLKSDSHKYLMEIMGQDESCELVKMFYDMGSKQN